MICAICGGRGDRIVTAADRWGVVRVVGGEVGTCTCAPVEIPLPPDGPLMPEVFADYLWSLHGILNKEKPDIGAGLEPERNSLTSMLSTFASFLSCAAEDRLWKVNDANHMALDPNGERMDTPWGFMEGMRQIVIKALEEDKKTA